MAEHIALLGDSIFDNGAYTNGAPDVVTHLRGIVPRSVRVSLLAIDGSTTADLRQQLSALPADASRVVLSIGGNDALSNADILNLPVESTYEALHLFAERTDVFEASYRAAISDVVEAVPDTTLCTVYNGNLTEEQATVARIALMMFNDVILRTAFALRLPIIDLRLICTEPVDYANPIEPSAIGGKKIARAIAAAFGIGTSTSPSRVFVEC
ncbi:MAG: SGNH/GDSL hydrolase family protein [Myxococcota bacterium]